MSYQIEAEGLERVQRALRESSSTFGKHIRGMIMEIGNYAKNEARGRLHPGGPGYVTGNLQREISLRIRSDYEGEVISEAPYSAFVEYGTRAHFPPVSAMVESARMKFGLHGKEAESVGFLVARAISRWGTRGIHFMEAAARFAISKVPETLNRWMKFFLEDLERSG